MESIKQTKKQINFEPNLNASTDSLNITEQDRQASEITILKMLDVPLPTP